MAEGPDDVEGAAARVNGPIGLLLLVAIGGAAGGLLRHAIAARVDRAAGDFLPWGTLAVNVSGSALAGFAAPLVLAGGLGAGQVPLWALLGVGVLGSYTTVSAVALQTHGMARGGRLHAAMLYGALSLVACLGAAAAGFGLGRLVAG